MPDPEFSRIPLRPQQQPVTGPADLVFSADNPEMPVQNRRPRKAIGIRFDGDKRLPATVEDLEIESFSSRVDQPILSDTCIIVRFSQAYRVFAYGTFADNLAHKIGTASNFDQPVAPFDGGGKYDSPRAQRLPTAKHQIGFSRQICRFIDEKRSIDQQFSQVALADNYVQVSS
jgi:hypothetical protein